MSTTRDVEAMVPADVEAEQSVLGSLLIDPEAITEVASVLKPEHFYREAHRWIYDACLAISDRFEAADIMTVRHELEGAGRLADVGGLAYLSQLVSLTPTSVHAVQYARMVRQCALQRALIRAGTRIAKLGYTGGEAAALLGGAFEELMAVSGLEMGQGFRSLAEVAAAERAAREEWAANPAEKSGLATGLPAIDRMLGGLRGGVFYVVAARPSMGKSMFALTLAVNVARQGKVVGMFTIEQGAGESWQRLVLARAGLNDHAIREGTAPVDWQRRYWGAWDEMAKLGIHLDDSREITTGTMRVRANQLRARWPNLGLLVVDYAQIASDPDLPSEELRISRITNRLQSIARQLDVPLLAVYQLSREAEKRTNHMPHLADLRYSGQIEQDADVVLMLYRKAYYHDRDPGNSLFALLPGEDRKLVVLIEKQRNGPTGVVHLDYDVTTGRIQDWRDR